MSTEKKPRGRPPLSDEERRGLVIKIRATAEENAKFQAVGGVAWFRRALKRAKVEGQ